MTDHLIEGAIGYAHMPGRGTTHFFRIGGHDMQVYITEKRRLVRVFVDHTEWRPSDDERGAQ